MMLSEYSIKVKFIVAKAEAEAEIGLVSFG
jgi:hypothetical protein